MSSNQSHRLHTSLLVLILITGLAILATLASSAFGGPLDPPAPPGATMKTLQQVEPRTPISSVPFTITESGSYYFTNNIIVSASSTGITIAANDVTIDLNGFAFEGFTTQYDGIAAPPAPNYNGLTIRNGTIGYWRNGISTESVHGAVYDDLLLRHNGGGLRAGPASIVDHVRAISNSDHGILVNEVPSISQPVGGSIIRNCIANGNGYDGIQYNDHQNPGRDPGSALIEDNVASHNGGVLGEPYGAGIRVNGNRVRVEGNNVVNNDGFGINVTGTNNFIITNSGALNLNATGNNFAYDNFSFAGGNYAQEETSPTVTNPLSNVNY